MTRDLTEEAPLVLVKNVPKLPMIPPRRSGGRLDQRTAQRWGVKGLCGVRLETILVGGQRYTSVPALKRFFAAVTEAKGRAAAAPRPPSRPGPGPAAASAELDAMGF